MTIKFEPQKDGGFERRRWPRFTVALLVQVYSDCPPGRHEGMGTNLNAGGMALHTTAELRVGDYLNVEFTLPETEQAVRARAVVRNGSVRSYGIEFLAEDDADRRIVEQVKHCLNGLAAGVT